MTNEEWILTVVENFYAKAKTDVLIGYHFRVIHDFDEHIPRIAAFWDLQLLGKTSRRLTSPFDVMNIHLKMGIHRGELGRWLLLFRKTLDEEVTKDPSKKDLQDKWEERLKTFEQIFLRFLGF